VIDEGKVWPLAPYTCTLIPGVAVISVIEDSRWALFRSITSPSASFGATAGLTCAVQAVEASPSIARLGSPNSLSG
jgi:hypothetical protein